MAGSRLEKIGSIFSRTTGLLESGAMRLDDKPIWYDVYAMYPPDRPPRFDREPPATPVRSIFYTEDIIRARFQQNKKLLDTDTYSFEDKERKSLTQKFIDSYIKLKAEGPLDDEQIFEVALEEIKSKAKDQLKAVEASAEQDEKPFEERIVKKEEPKKSLNLGDIFNVLKNEEKPPK